MKTEISGFLSEPNRGPDGSVRVFLHQADLDALGIKGCELHLGDELHVTATIHIVGVVVSRTTGDGRETIELKALHMKMERELDD